MSSKFANELRDTGRLFERTTKSHEISNANVRFNEKFRNLREKNVHSITKTIDTMKRIVHLDLKGSAPKLTYLVDLIPYFKRAGATGVLIEYEDFFPYENDLESIRNQNHYTKQEINQLIKFLKESNLEVIPLIQTYGHLEFVLKLKQFSHLREDKKHFQTISPCVEETYNKVLFPMIDQILATHPEDLQSIHIGCDEVLLMNKNPACSDITDHNDMTTQDWFIL
jgi:hexosaminidase